MGEYSMTGLSEGGWCKATYDPNEGYRHYRSDAPLSMPFYVRRFRVKPWSERWWKPWDSIEEYEIENPEFVWVEEDDEQKTKGRNQNGGQKPNVRARENEI